MQSGDRALQTASRGGLILLRALLGYVLAAVLFAGPAQADEVALETAGTTYRVPVIVNGAVKIGFTVDSGASDLLIPADTVLTLMRSGTLVLGDFVGQETYRLADGRTLQSRRFTLHAVRVGNLVLHDVVASVGPVTSTPLLGQSFLSRLGSWAIDNTRHVLVFNAVAGQPAVSPGQPAVAPGQSAASPGTRTIMASKTAATGMPLILNSATALNPDCSLIDVPSARVTQPPVHGEVRLIHRDAFPNYPASDRHAACNSVKVPSVVAEYTSAAEFTGSDYTVVEFIFPDGKEAEIKFAITVK
jgi:hypothetical protein